MVHELFVVGSVWFWLLVLAELGILIFCIITERKRVYASLISLGVFVAVLQCFTNANILQYVIAHPISLLFLLGLFLVGGCVWVFPRWYLFCTDHRQRYLELRDKFLSEKKLPIGSLPEELREEWDAYYKSNNVYNEEKVVWKPEPREYRDRIILWMTLWPISLGWTAITFVGVRFFLTVYYHITGVLRRISDNVFKEEEQDFQKPVVAARVVINEETVNVGS